MSIFKRTVMVTKVTFRRGIVLFILRLSGCRASLLLVSDPAIQWETVYTREVKTVSIAKHQMNIKECDSAASDKKAKKSDK